MEFLKRTGRFAAYPYFRGLFASLTQQSGLMLPPLPVISDGPRWVTSPSDVASRPLAKAKSKKGSKHPSSKTKSSKTKPNTA